LARESCARIAAELFPKINNHLTEEDTDKKKPLPTITIHASVRIAYLNPAGVSCDSWRSKKIVAPPAPSCVYPMTQEALYTRSIESRSGPHRVLYDATPANRWSWCMAWFGKLSGLRRFANRLSQRAKSVWQICPSLLLC